MTSPHRLNLIAGRLRALLHKEEDDWDGPLSRADIVAILTNAHVDFDRYQAEQCRRRAAGQPTLTLDQWLNEGREL